VHATPDATRFVRELFAQYGDQVADLEVRRASLEDTYMAMVHRHERAGLEAVGAR
jgi:ABC-2 type transport system ATP-binding protein